MTAVQAFISRPYAGAADLQATIDLLIVARPPEQIADYPSIVDLHELFNNAGIRANTRLWEDADGQLIGFAIVHLTYNKLLFEIAPQAVGSDVVSQMIAWGTERVRQAGQKSGEPIVLRASCSDYNTTRIALLEQHGFAPGPVRTLHMVRPLDEPIPAPQVPEGFAIRPVKGEGEVEALVALHRAAFGTENMTVEGRLSWMRAPEYDPELDLVAVAPDDRLAAYVFCSISREENALTGRDDGYTDPVATHPEFQRRGLAQALLLKGFHLLKRRGVKTARLSTGGENNAMQRTAQSVGYRVESTTIFLTKQ